MTEKPEGPREPNDSLTIVEYWDKSKGIDEKYVSIAYHVKLMQAYDQLKAENERLTIGITACAAERDALKEQLDEMKHALQGMTELVSVETYLSKRLESRLAERGIVYPPKESYAALQAKASEYEAALGSIEWITGYAKNWRPDIEQTTRDYCTIDRVMVETALEKWRPK